MESKKTKPKQTTKKPNQNKTQNPLTYPFYLKKKKKIKRKLYVIGKGLRNFRWLFKKKNIKKRGGESQEERVSIDLLFLFLERPLKIYTVTK